jgi:murein DD-endopeptidase MepM/ murein hydrolase activator NlpD
VSDPRVFKVDSPLMEGDDILSWQRYLHTRFRMWDIEYPVTDDGVYRVGTRGATASFMRAWGVENTDEALDGGLTPWWRSKLRDDRRTVDEAVRFESTEIRNYRAALRKRFLGRNVCYPVPNLITDDWGYHPPVHDGVDLMCPWKQPILAICDAIVRRVSKDGWWGKGARPTAGHPVSDGDGIVIIESVIDAGPFRPGLHFGYGHSENHVVKEGEHVQAGDLLGHAGWANGAHVHFMVNDIKPDGGFYTGRGDRDPMPYLNWAKEHS